MTQRSMRSRLGLVLFSGVFIILLSANTVLAKPRPDPARDRQIIHLVCKFLQDVNLNRPKLDDELSKRLFKRYLKTLDPTKSYFTKKDYEDLSQYETQLDDQLLQDDIDFAYKAFDLFLTRVAERAKLVEELLATPMDFTTEENLDTDYDKMEFATTDQEMRERWRKRIKFDLLMQKMGSDEVASSRSGRDGADGKLKKSTTKTPAKPVTDEEAKENVRKRYLGMVKRWNQFDNNDLLELYLTDLTTSVDPHSSYMSPATQEDFEIAMGLHLEGIGALLRWENGATVVEQVMPGGAAAADGNLKSKDTIIGVAQGGDEFVDVMDMKLRDVVKLIRGPKGTVVRLKVRAPAKVEPVILTLTRQKIELKEQEARGEIIEQGKKADGTPYKIGVIDLPSFYADMSNARRGEGGYKSATEDVRKLLVNFKAKGVDGVVLDLRRNGGGVLKEALALTGLFVDHGPTNVEPFVQVKGPDGKVKALDDRAKTVVYGGPLIVLISRYSASASEILAGALVDYGRALLVGDVATHGKGTVQQVIDLGDVVQANEPPKLGAMKLTIQQFYRVNGDSTQNRGVTSDIVLPSFSEYLATNEKDLDFALPFDQVPAVNHLHMNMVTDDLRNALKSRSLERIKSSAEFAKLAKEIDKVKEQRAKKSFPLNEKKLKEQFSKEDAENAELKADGEPPAEPKEEVGAYKFAKTPVNTEILRIMEDWLTKKG